MIAQGTPQEVAERALAASRTDGCVVIVEEASNANLRWAGNTLTTNGVASTRAVTVVAIDGARSGSVTRTFVPLAGVGELVAEAEALAADASPAADAAPLVAPRESPGWEEPAAQTTIEHLAGVARALGEEFAAAEAAGHALYGYAEHEVSTSYLASSTGLRLRHAQPSGRFELTGRSGDGARSTWSGEAASDLRALDVHAHAAGLAQRLEWARRHVELPAGRYETLLSPSAVSDLMVYLYWEAGALDAHEGRTVFSRPGGGTRVGERLTSLPVSLRSGPGMAGVGCPPFVAAAASSRLASVYDNGLPLGPTDWIREGELAALLQTRHSAQVTGLEVTPFIDNLELTAPPAAPTLEQMVQGSERALLLTCLWYIREVDPQTLLLTGLTRDGVYLVEHGEVVGAVNNFRFNESPVDLLRRASEAGESVRTLPRELGDYFTLTRMPPLRVADFNMSSVSQAS